MQRILGVLMVSLLTIFSVSAQNGELEVVASHSILADVVANVAGDSASVSSLIPINADPHTFQPTPRDLTQLADANVLFINGALFEEGLLDTIDNVIDETRVEIASTCIEIRSYEGHDHDDHSEHSDDEGHEHDDEHHGDEHSEHEGDHDGSMSELCEEHHMTVDALISPTTFETIGTLGSLDCDGELGHSDEEHSEEDHDEEHEGEHSEEHDHGVCDPHVWTLPQNVMLWTVYVRDVLIDADPANTDIYTANADAYLTELATLNNDFIEPMIATIPEENRILVTNHDSMGYFADAYGFEVVSTIIPGGSTVADPSPAEIVDVIEQIQDEGVMAIFSENTISDGVAEQISAETGAEIYLLYSGALSDTDGDAGTYIDYMRYNISTIVSALGN